MFPGISQLARRLTGVTALAAQRLPREEKPSLTSPNPELCLIESVAGTLRDGLSTISGFSKLLARGHPADAASASRHILESTEELNRFLANLLDFVRHEQGRLSLCAQQVDAAELIESALSDCRRTAERTDITILARLMEGVDLNCDHQRIRGAIANIVLWLAAKASAGSVIVLRLLKMPDGGVAIAVSSMVETAGLDAVFEPRPDTIGLTDFSLPVARRVALLHSGDVTAQFGADGMVTFRLMLPPGRVISPHHADACEQCAA